MLHSGWIIIQKVSSYKNASYVSNICKEAKMSEIWIFDVLSENETFFVIFKDYEVSKPDILMALMQKIDKKMVM